MLSKHSLRSERNEVSEIVKKFFGTFWSFNTVGMSLVTLCKSEMSRLKRSGAVGYLIERVTCWLSYGVADLRDRWLYNILFAGKQKERDSNW